MSSTAAEINTLDGVTAGTVTASKAVVVDANSDISGFRNVTLTGNLVQNPASSITPSSNGDLVVEATNNTTLTFKLKGSDGTVRTGTLTLS